MKNGGTMLICMRSEGGGVMANIKSAKKRILVSKKQADENKARKSQLKTVIKKANTDIENKAPEMEATVKFAMKKVDQAAAHGIIHKNKAARQKSALASKVNKANA